MRTARNAFAVRSGMLDGQMLSLADLQGLASLPTRPVLLGMVAGALQGPVANLARLLGNVLSNPPGRLLNDSVQTFNGLLEARAKQLEAA
jgi:ribosomal protein L10